MKAALAQIMKQTMDKCTLEQFWAVATTIGINSYIISKIGHYRATPSFMYAVVAFSTILTGYSVFFIIDRARAHITYAYKLYRIIELSDNVEKEIKDFFKSSGRFRMSDFSGAGFYVAIIACIYVGLLITAFS